MKPSEADVDLLITLDEGVTFVFVSVFFTLSSWYTDPYCVVNVAIKFCSDVDLTGVEHMQTECKEIHKCSIN